MNRLLLTVLMSVKNGEPYLWECVESILNQTYKDFKFLILDNASTDKSRDIIRSFNDPRIQLIELPKDIGQVAALNKGLDMIDTPLAARMDADDISMPRRFECQVAFMEKHPEVGACGTYATAFFNNTRKKLAKKTNNRIKWEKPCKPDDIYAGLLFGCALAHPSVMMRKALFDKYRLRYDEKIGFSEDWELWQKAAAHFPLANIPRYLLDYRIHEHSVSRQNMEAQRKVDKMLIQRALEPLGLNDHPYKVVQENIVLDPSFHPENNNPDFLDSILEWFRELEAANRRTGIYKEKSLRKAMKKRLFTVLDLNVQLKGAVLKVFFKESLFLYAGLVPSVKFVAKVFLFSLGLKKPK